MQLSKCVLLAIVALTLIDHPGSKLLGQFLHAKYLLCKPSLEGMVASRWF